MSLTATGSTGRSGSSHTSPLAGNDFEVFSVDPYVPPHANGHATQAATTVSHPNYVHASTQTYPVNAANAFVNASTQTTNTGAAVNMPRLPAKYLYLARGPKLIAPTHVIPHPLINNKSSQTRRNLLASPGNWPQLVMHNPNGVSVPDIATALRLSGSKYISEKEILDSYLHFTEHSGELTGFKLRMVNSQQVISYDPSVFTQPAPAKR
jgi:hypothetical protein